MTEDEMVNGIIDLTDMSLGKLWELVMDREAWHAAVHGMEKTLECPLGCKEIQPVNPEGNQS